MMTFSDLASVPSDPPAPFTDRLRLAVAAYLASRHLPIQRETDGHLRITLTDGLDGSRACWIAGSDGTSREVGQQGGKGRVEPGDIEHARIGRVRDGEVRRRQAGNGEPRVDTRPIAVLA